MSLLDVEEVVVVVKYEQKFRWFRSDRELWVLDLHKWQKEYVDAGYDLPDDDTSDRFGISIVNETTMQHFLTEMGKFEIDKARLGKALANRFPEAQSWWDVGKLFPIMFIDADRHHVTTFYLDGIPMERYVPDGWTSEFEDFASKFSEQDFPESEKFWVQDGVDMLMILNQRGAALPG
jgi:hypothetical protein